MKFFIEHPFVAPGERAFKYMYKTTEITNNFHI